MINQEILERAIQKAIAGGWEFEKLTPWRDGYGIQKLKSLEHLKEFDVEHILFSHDFAKALWGEGEAFTDTRVGVPTYLTTPQWQIHLQQMVIAEDPIKYLGDNIG